MPEAGTKRCVVAYAARERQYLWTVDLPAEATVAEALEAARRLATDTPTPQSGTDAGALERPGAGATAAGTDSAGMERAGRDEVPWDTAPVGIFGEPCDRQTVPVDGDRVEIYRPLRSDPRERRRDRVRRDRRSKAG
ncbi:MAG: RnfH family protein [Steroidobacteraceae bacterium]